MPVVSIRTVMPLMQQTVTVAPFASYDRFGVSTYGTGVTYQAAVMGETKLVITQEGQQVPSDQQVYLLSGAMVRPEDQITLSTQDAGSTESYAINPRILSVARYPFLGQQFCTVIYLGRGGHSR